MSNPNERTIRTKSGFRHEHLVRLHPEMLPPEGEEASRNRAERKFNMRIKQHDVFLLDELAKATNRPRSELINVLLHRILLDELMAIEKLDARLLVALTADRDAAYDPLAHHWSVDVLAHEINAMADNVMDHGAVAEMPPPTDGEDPDWRHSEEFLALRAKLKEVGR